MLKLGILLVDNEPDLLAANKAYLEIADYWVLTAESEEEALQICQKKAIHVALIDIRLEDNTDEDDLSGIQLAYKVPNHIYKIILTGYPNQEYLVRNTMKGPVANFLWKREGPKKVLEAIREAKIKINQHLVIKGITLSALADQMKTLRNLDPDARQTAEHVLHDLTCRLFHEKKEVRFREITPGHGRCIVVLVHPKDHGGDELDLAVKIGPRESVQLEEQHYKDYVKQRVKKPAILQLGPEWSADMGAIAYSFIGDQGNSVRTFSQYYNDDKVSVRNVKKTLKDLLEDCCANWYESKRPPEGDEQKPLDEWYRGALHLLKEGHVLLLKTHLELLLKQKPAGNFSFQLLNQNALLIQLDREQKLCLPNPVHFILEEHNSTVGDDFFKTPTLVAITHGDLHGGNIIVDRKGTAWLIDFFKTGFGPVLRDFAELESDIKFSLIQSLHLFDRYEVEQVLLATHSLKESFADSLKNPTPAQTRAIKVIQCLRKLASQLTGIADMREYKVALLFFALKRMMGFISSDSTKTCEEVAQYHALLSAAMICEQFQTEARKKDLPLDGIEKIFLNYAIEDRDRVNNLYQQFSDEGYQPWMDHKNIVGGEDWKRGIEQAIHKSSIFIACLSRRSASKRGYVQRELNQALDIAQGMLPQDIYIVPVMLEECDLPERLAKYQAVRLYQEDGWLQLLKTIEESKKRREQK